MNNFLLFSTILNKPWAIEPNEAQRNLELLMMVLDRHELSQAFFAQATEPFGKQFSTAFEALSENKSLVSFPQALDPKLNKTIPQGSTAVIPVVGSLLKYDSLCTFGMQSIASWVRAADADKRIRNILFYIDSPGGTTDGTQALAAAIKSVKKPTMAFIDGMMASAAVWIGSSADLVIAQNESTRVGSVGVILSFADMTQKLERDGVKIHNILSSYSKDKNKEAFEAMKGNYEPVIEGTLDPLALMFIEGVKRNRPSAVNSAEQWNTAKVFFAREALELGLIDAILDMGQAVDHLNEETPLIELQKSTTPKSKITMEQTPRLLAVLELEALEMSEEGAYLNADQLRAIEAVLEQEKQKEDNVADLSAQLETANEALASAQTERDQAVELSTRLQTDKEELTTANATLVEHNQELATQVSTLTMEVDALKEQDEVPAGGAHTEGDYKEQKPFGNDPEAQAIYSTRKKLGK